MNNEMELVYDEDTGTYVMVPIADTVQRSIFDSDFQQSQDEENDENVIDETAIEASEQISLLPIFKIFLILMPLLTN